MDFFDRMTCCAAMPSSACYESTPKSSSTSTRTTLATRKQLERLGVDFNDEYDDYDDSDSGIVAVCGNSVVAHSTSDKNSTVTMMDAFHDYHDNDDDDDRSENIKGDTDPAMTITMKELAGIAVIRDRGRETDRSRIQDGRSRRRPQHHHRLGFIDRTVCCNAGGVGDDDENDGVHSDSSIDGIGRDIKFGRAPFWKTSAAAAAACHNSSDSCAGNTASTLLMDEEQDTDAAQEEIRSTATTQVISHVRNINHTHTQQQRQKKRYVHPHYGIGQYSNERRQDEN